MYKVRTILAFVTATASLCIVAAAQPAPTPDAQWRAIMGAAGGEAGNRAALQQALKIAEHFPDGDPRLFETLVRLSVLCQDEDLDGCQGQSSTYLNRAFKMGPKVKPRDAHLANLLMDLGGAAGPQLAPDVYRDALQIRENLFGFEDQSVAETYAAMAAAYQESGNQVEARTTMQYALDIRGQAHAVKTAGYADLLEESARIYADAKDVPREHAEYERAIALRESLWSARDPRFVQSLQKIAASTQFEKELAFPDGLYRRILDIQRRAHREQSEPYFAALIGLARFLRWHKSLPESEASFEQAAEIRDKMGKKDAAAAECLEELAGVRMARGRYPEAIEAGEASFQVRARLHTPSERDTASLDALLAQAYLLGREDGRSEASFRALQNETRAATRYFVINTAEKLSAIYQDRGDYANAASKLEVAVASIEVQNPMDPRLPQQEVRLAQLYQRAGRIDDANRMNVAALRAVGRSVKNQAGPQRLKYVLIVIAILFFGVPVLGTATFGLLFGWFSRKMDGQLAELYRPPAEPGIRDVAVSNVEHRASVGSFLGLASGDEVRDFASATLCDIAPASIESAIAEGPASQPLDCGAATGTRVVLHADGSDLFALRVLNLLLSLFTLGIYSFWGKAKVRRYVCGQAEYLGDWFAFHGTGRELLFGWLRALPALAFIFLVPSLLPLLWQHRSAPYVAQLAAICAFLLLWPIARVGAYRYRLNRLSWRSVRFSYRGRAPRYLTESVAGWLLSAATLGLYVPFLQIRLRKLLMNQTYFGDSVFRFPGRGSDLFTAWLFALPLTVCSFGVGWAWWRAFTHRYCWAKTTFAGRRFRCTATGGKLLWLWVGNFLVIAPTLGLGMSWATLRTLRFWTKYIEIVGEPELTSISQDKRAASAAAESFADFLGFDFGF
jgi:uncharacterized membrane protein YjgN (DUF898 family)